MGFASYLEDINSRLTRIEEIVHHHNKSNDKKIDINEYFKLRREILTVIERVRLYIDRDIDLIENGELRKQNRGLQAGITKLEKEIAQLKTIKHQIDNDIADKDRQLLRAVEESHSLKKESNSLKNQVSHGAELRMGQKKTERNLSESLLDFTRLFQTMSEIIKSNAWHKDKEKIKQLESLIKTGMRKS